MTTLADEVAESKKGAAPMKRSKKQIAAAERRAEKQQIDARSAQLAQIVNLVIAGYSFEAIGAAIGASADDVERMLNEDTARYVRAQPALRVFVRNFISSKYNGLLEAVYDEATDKGHAEKLEHQDRALRILDRMAKLHGAEAPVQSEVKVDAAPEAVERMVQALSSQIGAGYDTSIFDVVDAEVIHEAAEASELELERSAADVEQDQPED